MRFGNLREFELRRWRCLFLRPQIGPYQPAHFESRIRFDPNLVLEVASCRLRRGFQARTVHIVLPTVVHASETVFLIAAEKQGSPAMGAEFVHETDSTRGIAKCHEPLAEELDANRRAIGFGELR